MTAESSISNEDVLHRFRAWPGMPAKGRFGSRVCENQQSLFFGGCFHFFYYRLLRIFFLPTLYS